MDKNMNYRIKKNNDGHHNNKNAAINAHDIGLPEFQIFFQNEKSGITYQQRDND